MILLKKSKTDNIRGACLFLNGMPGKIKDRLFFEHLSEKGIDCYTFYYPGTYGEKGTFNYQDCINHLESKLNEIDKMGIPIIIVAYSFSTLLIQNVNLNKYNNIVSLSLFSPIFGLNEKSISVNFINTLMELDSNNENQFHIDYDSWREITRLSTETDREFQFSNLAKLKIPVSMFFSINDKVIIAEILNSEIQSYLNRTSYNKLFVYCSEVGGHLLDSYYDRKILAFFEALLISIDLRKLIGWNTAVYYWGSGISPIGFNHESDIDLLLFTDQNHLNYVQKLREYQTWYDSQSWSKFDLSINDKQDLNSNKPFRFNRGPTIIHELKYHYFAFNEVENLTDIEWEDVLQDAYRATLINLLEAKKIFMKISLNNSRIRKIVKFYLFSIIYYLYFKGIDNIDWSNLPKYIHPEERIGQSLTKVLEIKKDHYKGINYQLLRDLLNEMTEIHKFQEHFLHNVK